MEHQEDPSPRSDVEHVSNVVELLSVRQCGKGPRGYLPLALPDAACGGRGHSRYRALGKRTAQSRSGRSAVFPGDTESCAGGGRARRKVDSHERRTGDVEAERLFLLEARAEGPNVRGIRRAGYHADLRTPQRDDRAYAGAHAAERRVCSAAIEILCGAGEEDSRRGSRGGDPHGIPDRAEPRAIGKGNGRKPAVPGQAAYTPRRQAGPGARSIDRSLQRPGQPERV